MNFLPSELIKKKRRGQTHTREELHFLIKQYSEGLIPDYQMSAWLMAVFFQGMDRNETSILTQEMMNSGKVIDLSSIPGKKVDKHSTGGVGDKASLILGLSLPQQEYRFQ
jgi:pyrimidine-nucleoside phosphorylase